MSIERTLAAIMFTDIVGYTEQMSKSESKSLDTLENKRSIFQPLIKEYNVKEIHSLIKDSAYIEFELNLRLYELLEDKSLLKIAYNQVQENASAMEDRAKFLELEIPAAIVEEWEKVK